MRTVPASDMHAWMSEPLTKLLVSADVPVHRALGDAYLKYSGRALGLAAPAPLT